MPLLPDRRPPVPLPERDSQAANDGDARNVRAFEEAQEFARRGGERLRKDFPGWEVTAEAANGSPAWELVAKADAWNPDLVVVGSHGRSALGRFVLGSVSSAVAARAHCSVEVVRAPKVEDEGRLREGEG